MLAASAQYRPGTGNEWHVFRDLACTRSDVFFLQNRYILETADPSLVLIFTRCAMQARDFLQQIATLMFAYSCAQGIVSIRLLYLGAGLLLATTGHMGKM